MKNIKWNSMFIALCYIGAGVFLILDPRVSQEYICTWLSYAAIAIGFVNALIYFLRPARESFFRNDFIVGMLLMTLGVLAIVYKLLILELVYIVLALVIMLSGYIKLQDCVDTWRLGSKHGFLYFVLAVISIGCGLTVLVQPFTTVENLHYLIGGGLIYSGISDLFSAIYLSGKMIRYARHLRKREEENNAIRERNEKVLTEPVVDETILDDENNNPEV